tara:strand:+ start:98 stop:958 length:861 start_codon:yes stop_codon:yes gene_type:complete
MESDSATMAAHYRLPFFLRLSAKLLNIISKSLTTKFLWKIFAGPIKFKSPDRELGFYEKATKSMITTSSERRVAIYRIPGDGRRLLFVHGWNGRSGQFSTLVDRLSNDGFDITAVDLPGHGNSDSGQTSLPQITDVLTEIAETNGPFDVLIAHSFGGVAGLNSIRLGANYQKVVLISLGGYEVRPMFENFVGLFGLDKIYYADRLFELVETRFGVNPLEFGPSEFVDKIMTETLLVHCNHDLESKSDISIMVHEKMPNSQLYLTNNLGHRKLLGNAEVIQRIADFI